MNESDWKQRDNKGEKERETALEEKLAQCCQYSSVTLWRQRMAEKTEKTAASDHLRNPF